MDWLDLFVAAAVLLAAVHGARVGAVVQLTSFAGFLAGIAVGATLVVLIDPHVGGAVAKTAVALVLLIVPATFLGAIARQLGARLWRLVRRLHFGMADALCGVAIAVGGTLVVCWLLASILVDGDVPALSRQIEGSALLKRVDAVMPPVPDTFAALERYLSASGFPEVFVNALPESYGPAHLASMAQRAQAVARAGPATVKVIAIGCGQEQEGSGFAVGAHLFVTNAHVVAGTRDISVEALHGQTAAATVVEFDPRFDLAILSAPALSTPVLRVDPRLVQRGVPAVVLGYPEGGPFDARRAGVTARFEAEGRDIYDRQLTTRTVYQLQAVVRPGNSGGPLIDAHGEVIGVVFSRSASNPDVGYALASPGVLQRVRATEADARPTSTEGCTS